MRRFACLALLFLAFLPTTAEAQAARPAVNALSIGEHVRVQAPGITVEDGTVSEVDDETLYVLEAGQEWLVDINAIERLEVQRRPVVKNVLIFTVVGALAGVAAREYKDTFKARHFAMGGAAFGALFGFSQTEWRVAFPR